MSNRIFVMVGECQIDRNLDVGLNCGAMQHEMVPFCRFKNITRQMSAASNETKFTIRLGAVRLMLYCHERVHFELK